MTQNTDAAVRLTRTFEAPREVMWRMWTDPAEFAAWYGPPNATIEVVEWHLNPGGARQLVMEVESQGELMTMRFAGEFLEVTEPERLVYTEALTGRDHPVTRVEVEFYQDEGRTTVELTHHGIPAGSPGEAGWTMALDKLAARMLLA